MSQVITISTKDILQQVKLACKIPAITEQIVTRKIIMSVAAEVGIVVEAKELQQAADNLRLAKGLQTANDTLLWLKKNSISLTDFEEIVYLNVISQKLAQYLFAEQVESWFYTHQLDYAAAVIYEVMFDDQGLAMEIFGELQAGETRFLNVADQYIQNQELRRIGGYLGIVSSQKMKPEIAKAVFASQPPQILKPIVTSQGIHLILVEEVIKPQLDEQMRSQILSDLFADWIKHKLEEVEVLSCID